MSFFSFLFGRARAAERDIIGTIATDLLKVSVRVSSLDDRAKAQFDALIAHAHSLEERVIALEAKLASLIKDA